MQLLDVRLRLAEPVAQIVVHTLRLIQSHEGLYVLDLIAASDVTRRRGPRRWAPAAMPIVGGCHAFRARTAESELPQKGRVRRVRLDAQRLVQRRGGRQLLPPRRLHVLLPIRRREDARITRAQRVRRSGAAIGPSALHLAHAVAQLHRATQVAAARVRLDQEGLVCV